MKQFLYLSLLLAGALVVVFGAAAVLERQASQQREVRIEQQQQPAPQSARTSGTPASSKGRTTPARTAATMDDGI